MPLYGVSDTQPGPGADYAPGFAPPCPEPCVDYAHTIDAGTVYDYRWDCPDPCSQTRVSPGAGDEALAVWCPPPDPCPVYFDSGQPDDPSLIRCPDPCGLDGGDAVWCPPPCPLAVEPNGTTSQSCPEPCPLYAARPDGTPEALVWCPPTCELVGGDAVVCPEPCTWDNSDADVWCIQSETAPAQTAVGPTLDTNAIPVEVATAIEVATPVATVEVRASNAATHLVQVISSQLLRAMTGLRFTLFG